VTRQFEVREQDGNSIESQRGATLANNSMQRAALRAAADAERSATNRIR